MGKVRCDEKRSNKAYPHARMELCAHQDTILARINCHSLLYEDLALFENESAALEVSDAKSLTIQVEKGTYFKAIRAATNQERTWLLVLKVISISRAPRS